jgi:hypothetical protein
MFWSKKKSDKNIKDPVARYGELMRKNNSDKVKASPQNGAKIKNPPHGSDREFVYYED